MATVAPALARRSRTTPSTGAVRTCSIFMASTTTSRSPAVTVWPSATSTKVTVPGIGERTGPPAPVDGVVRDLRAKAGATVAKDAVLLTVEGAEAEED